ncbi:MAG: hypothetical protein ABSD75_06910 [Terriglobales bacterium]
MPEITEKRWNWPLWWGFLLVLAAMLCNVVLLVKVPGQRAIPWLSVLLAAAGLVLLVRGLQHAFGQPPVYRRRILSSILSLVSLLLASLAFFVFFYARALPPSLAAPHVGQKAPDFTLPDTAGQPVSLDGMLLPRDGVAPKAVLLIFYRGYW